MYPSSSSSSSQGSMGPNGLTRYGSAPGSELTTAVDSATAGAATRDFSSLASQQPHFASPADTGRSNRSYGTNQTAVGGDYPTASINLNSSRSGGGSLVRQSSSPAGFLHQLSGGTSSSSTTAAPADTGFSVTRAIGSYNPRGASDSGHGVSRLASQLSFTRQDSLSRISEESENATDGICTGDGQRKASHSYSAPSFGMGAWDDTNTIVFSASPSKRPKNITSDFVHGLNAAESQFHFSLPETALETSAMEDLLQIPQDSVPCKIRAKRGCATHPRSIAERERRTRISSKLKKLQELVPNMDKQTSYADMLDLAVNHIKGLQNEVQKLKKELKDCSCGSKQTN